MNMMLLPADAAVPALSENSNMAAEMAAGRTRVTARALIAIGMSRVMVVIASLRMININNRPAAPSSPRPMLICTEREICFCTAVATTPPRK
ncbi:hypothetical protein D3C84_777890 [compost metagenome]